MDKVILKKEMYFRTARSGGSGGQHVNKVETKVEAIIDLLKSEAFDAEEKSLLQERLALKISNEGTFSVTNQTERSQLSNKVIAIEKLIWVLENALKTTAPRKQTRVPRNVKKAIRLAKTRQSEKKQSRKKPNIGFE